ncbi:DUF2017 domain-containing protein [Serinicoccus hydrothermalis]|uniref:DUF2017 domain-containing protein n=1 Tax=Serinicoccus hydrothermalis TaxID=1758689 RepID=A0A1B1NGS6_9MICO|nr:DUF2017 domain-containing protein [Serinicoccus hydrothermalis]ANS80624.1 DUF2017 domain-containing protein [Serinicoccus hydrothermalis]
MARAFRRRKDRVVASFEAQEIEVLVHVLGLTRDFVAPERPETGDPFLDLVAGLGDEIDPEEPSDPALRRLLPPASRDDDEQAAEFRRLTEHGLRQRKAATLSTAINALEAARPPRLDLDLEEARALVVALTDARLILGERLGLRTDEDSERLHEELEQALAGKSELDPALAQKMAYYDFLSWVQESVTLALMAR